MRPRPEVRTGSGGATSTRPRPLRIIAAGGALVIVLVSVLGASGVLPVEPDAAATTAGQSSSAQREPSGSAADADGVGEGDGAISLSHGSPAPAATGQDAVVPVPADSGTGRRIVFDTTQQRVWLVGERAGHDVVRRTYLVSGSVTDNLAAGSYTVYSKSMRAWGVDDSGSMRYMVRFARGPRAAIGFHDIPEVNERPVQGRDALGSPQSHGCIRQSRPDARALWSFAPVGTRVVVT